MKHYGVWLLRTRSGEDDPGWLRFENGAIFWTTSPVVAELQRQLSGFLPHCEVRSFEDHPEVQTPPKELEELKADHRRREDALAEQLGRRDAALEAVPVAVRAFYRDNYSGNPGSEGVFQGLSCKVCRTWRDSGHAEDCPVAALEHEPNEKEQT